MPSYVKILTDQQMWEVSGLLSVADKPLPAAVQQVLAQHAN
jgi:thiosulfate dehydrogenase